VKWDAESAADETKSTHLWLVNRALDILSRHTDLAAAASVVSRLHHPGCTQSWQQGLVDADFLAVYNNGLHDIPIGASTDQIILAGSTWASHFYDPDTGTNYQGETDPTALSETLRHARAATNGQYDLNASVASDQERTACYELGLALHYFTDITQPMHAANFTATHRPRELHSNLEGYTMTIQDRYAANDWSATPSGDLEPFIIQTAHASKDAWPALHQTVLNAYDAAQKRDPVRCGQPEDSSWNFIEAQQFDHSVCWVGDADVDQGIGAALQFAQDRTAQFLYLLERHMTKQ